MLAALIALLRIQGVPSQQWIARLHSCQSQIDDCAQLLAQLQGERHAQ